MENIIIVRNLPKDVCVPELCDQFRCFGRILSATVHCDDQKMSTGEGNIEFDQHFSALKAVKRMNNYQLRKKTLQVFLATENEHFRKVFVKDLNPDWDECDLLKIFEPIGTVESVKVAEENGKSLGYGFVIFANHYTAKRAIESMNSREIGGRKLIVERFKSKTERDSLKTNSIEYLEKRLEKSTQKNNLHIKNLPPHIKEDELRGIFKKYGTITSIYVPVDNDGYSKQFGFVCFEREDDAEKARRRMNGFTLEGKRLEINFKQDGQVRRQLLSLKNKEREVMIKEYKKRSQSLPKFVPSPLSHKNVKTSEKYY